MKQILGILCFMVVIAFVHDSAVAQPPKDEETTLRDKWRGRALKVFLEVKVAKEKRKLFRKDTKLINGYQTILDSPTLQEITLEKAAPEFDKVETQLFAARGPPKPGSKLTNANWEAIFEKLLKFIEDGGLEKILEFVLAIIDAVAINHGPTIQQGPDAIPPTPAVLTVGPGRVQRQVFRLVV